jgi:hypothetical protein
MSTQETFRFGKVQGSWFMSLNLTIQQQSNARINRARTQHSYHKLNDKIQANSRSGSMSC